MHESLPPHLKWALHPIPTLIHLIVAAAWIYRAPVEHYLFLLPLLDKTFFVASIGGVLIGIPLFATLSFLFWQLLASALYMFLTKGVVPPTEPDH